MSDPSYDAFAQSLLSSAKSDGMSAERKDALLAALAAGPAVGPTPASSGGPAAAKAPIGPGMSAVKWIVAGAVSIVVAGGVGVGVHQRGRADNFTPATTHSSAVAPSASVTPLTVAPEPAPEAPPLEALPPEALPSAPSRKASAARVSTTAAGPTLADELRLVEQARSALAANDVASAERALAAHARTFPSGAFAEEARVLRIDARARGGNRAPAESDARAFLSAHPDSPYAPRLRALLGEEPSP